MIALILLLILLSSQVSSSQDPVSSSSASSACKKMAIDKLPVDEGLNSFSNGVGIFPTYTLISDQKSDLIQYYVMADKSHFDLINWKLFLMNDHSSSGSSNSGSGTMNCIDLGGNIGSYSLHMAKLGCHSHYFEMQPKLVKFATYSVHANSLQNNVSIYHLGVSDKRDTMTICGDGGTAYLGNSNSKCNNNISVVLGEDCLSPVTYQIAKIDVEGFEIRALNGISGLISKGLVETLLIEIAPNRWDRPGLTIDEGTTILSNVLKEYNAYIIIRAGGPYSETCPSSLMDSIGMSSSVGIPLSLGQVLHMLTWDKMLTLMKTMATGNMDCNFWFIKGDMKELTTTKPIRSFLGKYIGNNMDGVAVSGMGKTVYMMEGGKKRAVPNYDTYIKLGIKTVIQMGGSLDDIPDGEELPSDTA